MLLSLRAGGCLLNVIIGSDFILFFGMPLCPLLLRSLKLCQV